MPVTLPMDGQFSIWVHICNTAREILKPLGRSQGRGDVYSTCLGASVYAASTFTKEDELESSTYAPNPRCKASDLNVTGNHPHVAIRNRR